MGKQLQLQLLFVLGSVLQTQSLASLVVTENPSRGTGNWLTTTTPPVGNGTCFPLVSRGGWKEAGDTFRSATASSMRDSELVHPSGCFLPWLPGLLVMNPGHVSRVNGMTD